ncbi:MAG: branched-chain amino acid ABC transporter permease [Clostridia bacterium]|nr:branched-chain amino acid ABC transporter permease [Clostridia bacterium]
MNLVPFLISGVSIGGQYALIAVGYTLVYGILRLINFAHSDVFMVAGLVMVYMTTSLPMQYALPIVVVATVALGFIIERVAYKPLRTAPRMSLMISAIGVSYLIQNLAYYLTGGLAKPVTNLIPWISDTITIFGQVTKRVTVITPILTVLIVIGLVALIKNTKIGLGMRAAARDFEAAQLMGIKINGVISFTFIVGSFLASIGAMLYFTNFPSVAIGSGGMPGLNAFVAAVFGGIGSIPGAVVGAFIIGICQELIKGLGASAFSDAFTFVLLIIILCVKPTGLFGEKTIDKV